MNSLKATFLSKSDIKAQDLEHKRKLAFNIDKYAETVVKGKQQFTHLDVVREKYPVVPELAKIGNEIKNYILKSHVDTGVRAQVSTATTWGPNH